MTCEHCNPVDILAEAQAAMPGAWKPSGAGVWCGLVSVQRYEAQRLASYMGAASVTVRRDTTKEALEVLRHWVLSAGAVWPLGTEEDA